MKKQEHELNQRLMSLAVPMAAAVMAKVQTTLPVSPDSDTPEVSAACGMMFRLTRTFAAWLAASEGNPTYWPSLPKLDDDTATSGGGGIPPVPSTPPSATGGGVATTTARYHPTASGLLSLPPAVAEGGGEQEESVPPKEPAGQQSARTARRRGQ